MDALIVPFANWVEGATAGGDTGTDAGSTADADTAYEPMAEELRL